MDKLTRRMTQDIFVVTATNRKDDLDTAIVDRFGSSHEIKPPSVQQQIQILKTRCEAQQQPTLMDDTDWKQLAPKLAGLSGRALDRILVNAAIKSYTEKQLITEKRPTSPVPIAFNHVQAAMTEVEVQQISTKPSESVQKPAQAQPKQLSITPEKSQANTPSTSKIREATLAQTSITRKRQNEPTTDCSYCMKHGIKEGQGMNQREFAKHMLKRHAKNLSPEQAKLCQELI